MDVRTHNTQPVGHKLYKYLCICADDFALSEAIDAGIIDLLQKGRLQAVSCMTQSPLWQSSGKQLLEFSDFVDIGLHFNLTQPFTQNINYPLSQLMQKAWLRRLDRNAILDTLNTQWDDFVKVMGKMPAYVDGHQHIHQFPVIRDLLIDFLQRQQFHGWVRSLQDIKHTKPYGFKGMMLQNLGAKQLTHLCQRADILQNHSFIGVYDFAVDADYAKILHHWLAQINDHALLMCHPAMPLPTSTFTAHSHHDDNSGQNSPADNIMAARIKEYEYLSSAQFAEQLQQFNLHLMPLSQILNSTTADQIGG